MANALILKELIEYLGISIAKFERKIGVTGSSITKAIDRNSSIKDYTIDKIVAAYPDVNRKWLETGKGEMFIDSGKDEQINTKIHTQENNSTILDTPFINQKEIPLMIHKLIIAQADYAAAAKEQAIANKETAIAHRNNSEANLMLTEMLHSIEIPEKRKKA